MRASNDGSVPEGETVDSAAPFFKDIARFLHYQRITFVDVGAYQGAVFREIVESELRVQSVHLIEPNPFNLAHLEQETSRHGANAHLHHVALSDQAGHVTMRDRGSMTRVESVAAEDIAAEPTTTGDGLEFTVETTTLDVLATEHRISRIHILKLDVEGHELPVLRGATELLTKERVDIVYVEAGFDPGSRQQTYYQDLEAHLRSYGYRPHKVYEQKNEWPHDDPALRRVNIAFMSSRFRARHPMQLSQRFYEACQANEEMHKQISELQQSLTAQTHLVAELDSVENAFAVEVASQVAKLEQELSAARIEVRDLERDLRRVKKDRKALLRYADRLEASYGRVLKSTSWRVTGPMRIVTRFARRWLTGRAPGKNRLPTRPALSRPAKDSRPIKPTKRSRTSEGAYAKEAASQLWWGFSRAGLRKLRALDEAQDGAAPDERAMAARELSRWHAARGDYAEALKAIGRMREHDPSSRYRRNQWMLEAYYLGMLGRHSESRALIRAREREGLDVAGHLLLANSWNYPVGSPIRPAAEARLLQHLNAVYRAHGLSPVKKRRATEPLSLDNLTGILAPELEQRGGPLVTVLVPVHNAERTIETALRCLAEQTWVNLEVIVIDDASDDTTVDLVRAFCRADDRFRLLTSDGNRGAYVARNRGLRAAKGKLVTVHDGDDWSHPEKLTRQVRAIMGSDLPYVTSDWVRTTEDLIFMGQSRPHTNLILRNDSSSLFWLSDVRRLGGWDDRVRTGADTEFLWRMERSLGGTPEDVATRRVLPGCPLSLGRHVSSSLTRMEQTHVSTIRHGVRREYREAADWWHRRQTGRGRTALHRRDLAFPVPHTIRSSPPESLAVDCLFVGDFNMAGGTTQSALAMMHGAVSAGLSTAMIQYRRADLPLAKPLSDQVRDFAFGNGVEIVAAGEEVEARSVIVTHPPLFSELMDRLPRISCERLIVVVNQMAERDVTGADVAYEPKRVRSLLDMAFGTEGEWVPISPRVRRLMRDDPRYPEPSDATWLPLIDTSRWRRSTHDSRRGERNQPIIGRHGRDHRLKWPASDAALREAYCAERPCEVRFLGGATHARSMLDKWPSNWQEVPFRHNGIRDFIEDLDFFVHYPHEEYIEEFGRAVIEAMALGVPAILPPVFEETFGDAAVYATPEDVWAVITELWSSERLYAGRVEAGLAYVRTSCDLSLFAGRLTRPNSERECTAPGKGDDGPLLPESAARR